MKDLPLTPEEARTFLAYKPREGIFVYTKKIRGGRAVGERAGSICHNKYRLICINQKRFYEHRLAWFWKYGVFPKGILDHVNGDPGDNRLCNLRLISYSHNSAWRKGLNKNNTSGFRGVIWIKRASLWHASIKVNRETHSLGCYKAPTLAARAYDAAAIKYFGNFAKTNRSMGLL